MKQNSEDIYSKVKTVSVKLSWFQSFKVLCLYLTSQVSIVARMKSNCKTSFRVKPSSNLCGCGMKPMWKCEKWQFLEWLLEAGYRTYQYPWTCISSPRQLHQWPTSLPVFRITRRWQKQDCQDGCGQSHKFWASKRHFRILWVMSQIRYPYLTLVQNV